MKKLAFLFLLMLGFNAFSQPWLKYLQTPKGKEPSFFEIQEAFRQWEQNYNIDAGYIYKDGQKIKVPGWKQFKRWEYLWLPRVNEQGYAPAPSYLYQQYANFQQKQKQSYGDWQIIGPITIPKKATSQPNGLGRINGIAFDPADSSRFYVCTASGGFWRTDDFGQTWIYLSGPLPTLGTSDAAIDPQNPNIIYLATGDRDAYDAKGLGVWKSYDYGQTWTRVLDTDVTVNMLLIDPANNKKIIAATTFGIFISEDAGETWTQTLSGNRTKDIEFHPLNSDIIYATGEGKLFKSTDGGYTWTDITSHITTGLSATRNVIGVSPAQPDWLYVLVTNDNSDLNKFTGIYLSKDAGETFTLQTNSPNILGYNPDGSDNGSQAWYDLCIAVDPNDASVIYTGGVNIWKSVDTAKNMFITAHWTGSGAAPVHADHHDLMFHPSGKVLFSCNDGGVYYTVDNGKNWTEITSGLSISQVYRIGASANIPFLFLNGYQDNGTALATDIDDFNTVIGGDGMECIIDYSDNAYKYGELYFGDIRRSINGSDYVPITGVINEYGYWVTPYELNPQNPKEMTVGKKSIWQTNNVKSPSVSWYPISEFNDSYSTYALKYCKANTDIIYFSRTNGRFYRIESSATYDLSLISDTINYFVTSIETSSKDENIVYVTVYDRISSRSLVLKSTDKGVTWENITLNLPNVFYNSLTLDTSSNKNGLYLGTFTGVYYKNDSMDQWVAFDKGLPVTDVRELQIYYAKNPAQRHIKAATYGRGTWYSPLYTENNLDAAIAIPEIKTFCLSDRLPVIIANIGSKPLTGLTVQLYIDSKPAKTIDWTGILETNESDTLWFPQDLFREAGQYDITVAVELPDTLTDENPKNNTANTSFEIKIQKPDFMTDFSGGNLPECWSYSGNWKTTYKNLFNINTLSASNGYLYLDIDTNDTFDATVNTCAFDFSGQNGLILSLEQVLMLNPGSTAKISYSTDTEQWNDLYVFNSSRGNYDVADIFDLDISSLAGLNPVYLRFSITGSGTNRWILDDIAITAKDENTPEIVPVLVYPNPAAQSINISFRTETQQATIKIFSAEGRIIKYYTTTNPQFESIDVSNLNNGIYFIEIDLPESHILKRFIVQH